MGARQLGVLSLFSWTSALWVGTQNPESVPFPTVSPSHDPQLPFPALWLSLGHGPKSGFSAGGVHCQGGGCSWGTSVPRCYPLPTFIGHQMSLAEGRAMPRSVGVASIMLSPEKRKAALGPGGQ